ncbi:asparagine synthase-related protein [Halopelagius longus]|uniref:Asparagine synthase n=1 Tax=Halopelagius longus TaxID=1236180 RepID=A0A1H1GMS4_9EURY|nr:asparagine synthase-related protein [Halopelagius longus]RDI69651.1 asparagine synthase [Halopelagius longus]SDR14459.1 asparagine synthase (glutamine-hydrolysing) [Halopelagius longus]
MTGLIGGSYSESTLRRLLGETPTKAESETVTLSRGDYALGVEHLADRDPGGWETYDEDGLTGVVYGAVSNLSALSWDAKDLFERAFENPTDTLPNVDGPFVLACTDGDRLVVATDKLGTRSVYYAEDGDDFVFGSNLNEVAETVEDPTVDERAVGDLLMIGHVWGDKTLLEEVTFLDSGSALEYEGDDPRVRRYWNFEFDTRPKSSFTPNLVSAYRTAIRDSAATMDDSSVGLWLSGGLDSRTMAGELSQYVPDMRTYTYDANPAGGGNIELAREICDILGLENEEVDLTPGPFVENFEDAVTITDGMLGWNTFLNLTATFSVPEPTDILLEACGQGGMMGDGIGRSSIELSDSREDALYRAKHQTDKGTVSDLLSGEIDLDRTYEEEVAKSGQDGYAETVMDAYYRNYFPRGDFASNKLVRSRAGTRVPFAHGEFLRAVTQMPLEQRVGWIPGTRGKIPSGTAEAKLDLAREIGYGMAEVPYERTKMPPEEPLWKHVAGFVTSTSVQRLRGTTAYGGRRMQSVWSISDDEMRSMLVDLLDDAAEREFLDADAVETIAEEHFETQEVDHIGAVSGLTTLEQWLQTNYD